MHVGLAERGLEVQKELDPSHFKLLCATNSAHFYFSAGRYPLKLWLALISNTRCRREWRNKKAFQLVTGRPILGSARGRKLTRWRETGSYLTFKLRCGNCIPGRTGPLSLARLFV